MSSDEAGSSGPEKLEEPVYVRLYAHQLGHLSVEHRFRVPATKQVIHLPCAFFKYEMPKVMGIPIPVSSLARETDVELLACEVQGDSTHRIEPHSKGFSVQESFEGNKALQIEIPEGVAGDGPLEVTIRYRSHGFQNHDQIFFNFTYALVNFFEGPCVFSVDLDAHFSYRIRSHRIHLTRYDAETGKVLERLPPPESRREGDMIQADLPSIEVGPGEEVDIYVTGTRLPFPLPRAVFWSIVFLVALTVLLAPLLQASMTM